MIMMMTVDGSNGVLEAHTVLHKYLCIYKMPLKWYTHKCIQCLAHTTKIIIDAIAICI